MALTTDQATLLRDAVSNLNKSIEINQQVLDIVRSVGNTGAVDIAMHNTDADAHPVLNNINVKNDICYTEEGKDRNTILTAKYGFNVKKTASTSTGGVDVALYGVYLNSESQNTQNLKVQFYQRNPDDSDSLGASVLGAIQARFLYKEGDAYKTRITNSINFTSQASGERAVYITNVTNDGSTSSALWIYRNELYSTHPDGADLGDSAHQWKDLYLKNSPIVSSDRRLKQDFSDVPEAVFKAWGRISFKRYKFKEAVASKGDSARWHIGLVAQDIVEAFEAEGLDAIDYGIVCHDSWDDQYQDVEVEHVPAVVDETGKVVAPEKSVYEHQLVKKAGDVWTVRYEEALALESAYQRWRFTKIEAALSEKGITL